MCQVTEVPHMRYRDSGSVILASNKWIMHPKLLHATSKLSLEVDHKLNATLSSKPQNWQGLGAGFWEFYRLLFPRIQFNCLVGTSCGYSTELYNSVV